MGTKKIKKAVFPVAGLGTRFLPVTKASAKEMLPVVDKPLIQYAVEEVVRAGIDSLIFVSGKSKRAIEDHFDSAPELERQLEEAGKTKMLKVVQEIVPSKVSCIYLRQATPLGLGHAVLCAKPVIGDEPFAVLLADDLIVSDNSISNLINAYEKYDANVVAVEKVEQEDISKYGIMGGKLIADNVWKVEKLVEKPQLKDAPSDLAVIGRYLFKPSIFDFLSTTTAGVGGEIQLTDAITEEAKQGNVVACLNQGIRYDCGDKLGYLKANVEIGMRDPQIGQSFRDYLLNLKDRM